ncbi:MAG: Ig-like domain-containing protein [Planctomycetes bacterium]|nr:Ig-like domain-containing protein [Planctomycetota bacterium]
MNRIICALSASFVFCAASFGQPSTQNLLPQDLEGSVAIPPTLEIDCSAPNLVAARYRIANDPMLSDVVEDTGDDSNDVCQHVVLTALSGQTTYYWSARVKDVNGAWSAWSSVTSFTTQDPTGLHRIVFQNGAQGYAGTADADIRGSFADPNVAIRDWNQGGQDVIRTGRRPAGSDTDEIYRTLLRFDLGTLSDPNAVVAAYVELTGWQHDSNTPFDGSNSLYEVRREWGEGIGLSGAAPSAGEVSWTYSAFPATWSIPGAAHASDSDLDADRAQTALAREILTNEVGYKTKLSSRALVNSVKRWIADSSSNHGVLLAADDETFQQVLNIASREHADWTFRPRLVVYSTETPARPPDLPPLAVDDASLADSGVPVHIAVLANDSDQDVGPDPIRLVSVGTPTAGGGVEIQGDEIVYTLPLFAAFDTFTYTITDGERTATATVRITNSTVCLRGNVNSGAGATADVLLVNGTPGDQNRVVFASVGQSITIHLDAAPFGPSAGRYALWIWSRPPANAVRLVRGGVDIGCLVNPSPFTRSLRPQPIRCLRGTSVPASVCRGVRTLPAPPSAPWTVTRTTGVGRAGNFSLQGILQDPGSANSTHFSVTNAVILRVQ